jgi:hypothetical protein
MKRLRAAVEARDPSAPKVCTPLPSRFRRVASRLIRLRFRRVAVYIPGTHRFPQQFPHRGWPCVVRLRFCRPRLFTRFPL